MYNNKPLSSDLPTSRQLLRSTIIALIVAGSLLVTVVLPAEYAIDPTGIGRVLGLTEMGEIKGQLAEEAAIDAAAAAPAQPAGDAPAKPDATAAVTGTAAGPWRDEMRVELAPDQGVEIKLAMNAGQKADFEWAAEGGVVNFDMHGDGGKEAISYEKGRGAASDEGVLEAAFDGNHGWFWRNRGQAPLSVVVRTRGEYAEMKRM
jgi:hypothetical protein